MLGGNLSTPEVLFSIGVPFFLGFVLGQMLRRPLEISLGISLFIGLSYYVVFSPEEGQRLFFYLQNKASHLVLYLTRVVEYNAYWILRDPVVVVRMLDELVRGVRPEWVFGLGVLGGLRS